MEWGVLAAALTLLGAGYTWFAYQRRGLGAGVRGAGITLLPIAAYLTRTLEMLGRVVDAVVDWATRLVLSPTVWVGIVIAVVAVVLIAGSRLLDRGPARSESGREVRAPRPGRREVAAPAAQDDDLADIEAILKKRGIS